MNPLEATLASADAINGLGSHFMMDMDTYAHGAELGFDGLDFYVAGRGGALGDVSGSDVATAFVFFEPTYVATSWDRTADILPRDKAAAEFAGVATRWANDHVPDDFDAARLAELAGRVGDAASPAGAPLFAGWRALAEPTADQPKALAIHRVNALRELRGALHGAAILSQGISAHAAVACRTPYMLDVFGWPAPHPDKAEVSDAWDAAQVATDLAVAHAFEPLSEADRAEFAALANALQAAVTAA